jgi:bacterial/archaeal transporter family-2 protein
MSITILLALTMLGLGPITAISDLILGQMLTGVAIHATGAFGLPTREIGCSRIGSVTLVLAGIVLSRA